MVVVSVVRSTEQNVQRLVRHQVRSSSPTDKEKGLLEKTDEKHLTKKENNEKS
jgi:hypothetical protein